MPAMPQAVVPSQSTPAIAPVIADSGAAHPPHAAIVRVADSTIIKRFDFGEQRQGDAWWNPQPKETEVALIGNSGAKQFKVQVSFIARPQVKFNGHEVMKVYFQSKATAVGSVIVFHWPSDPCNRDVRGTLDATALVPLNDIDAVRMVVEDGNPTYTQGKAVCG
jgi:hypothetical protein